MTGIRSVERGETQQPPTAGTAQEWPQAAPGGRSSVPSSGHGSRSDVVRERAIVALLAEKTIGAAASRSGVGERTLRRWMTEDEGFQAALAEARRAAFEAGTSRVQALMSKAVDTLDELLDVRIPRIMISPSTPS